MFLSAVLLLMSSTADALFGLKHAIAGDTLVDQSLKAPHHKADDPNTSLTTIIIDRLRNYDAFDIIQASIHHHASLPTCNKHAYSSLVRSCQSLEYGNGLETDQALDTVKSTFAAHLGACDLLEVGQDAVPHACQYLLGSPQVNTSKDPSQPEQLQACLRGMHDDHNAWTSFTSAKQNAVVICHATRLYVERDAVLEEYRIQFDIAKNVSAATWSSTQAILEVQSEIRNAAQDLIAELQRAREASTDQHTILSQDMGKVSTLAQQLQEILEFSSDSIEKMLQQATRNSLDLLDRQTSLSHSQELALDDLQAGSANAARMHQMVADLVISHQVLLADHGDISNSLGSMKTAMSSMEQLVDDRIAQVSQLMRWQDELQFKIQATTSTLDQLMHSVVKTTKPILWALESVQVTFSAIGALWPFLQLALWLCIAYCFVRLLILIVCPTVAMLRQTADLLSSRNTDGGRQHAIGSV